MADIEFGTTAVFARSDIFHAIARKNKPLAMRLSYERQKQAALEGRAEYDWFVGTRYDRIPTTEFYRGFGDAFDDRTHASIYEDVHVTANLPHNAQDLYDDHDTSAGLPGFHQWHPDRIAIDIAPVLVNRKTPQMGQLASAFYALHSLPKGERFHGGLHVASVDELQRDAGYPIGILFGPSTSREERRFGEVSEIGAFSKH